MRANRLQHGAELFRVMLAKCRRRHCQHNPRQARRDYAADANPLQRNMQHRQSAHMKLGSKMTERQALPPSTHQPLALFNKCPRNRISWNHKTNNGDHSNMLSHSRGL